MFLYMKKYNEYDRVYHRELVWLNAYNLVKSKEKYNMNTCIRLQKKFINDLDLLGPKRYKSLDIIKQYFKAPANQSGISDQILYQTIRNKIGYAF